MSADIKKRNPFERDTLISALARSYLVEFNFDKQEAKAAVKQMLYLSQDEMEDFWGEVIALLDEL